MREPGRTRNRLLVGWLTLVAGAFVVASWALMPLKPVALPEIPPPLDQAGGPPSQAVVTLDQSAFRTPLWVAPTPPPVVSAPTVQSLPPLRWQLLAIIRVDDAGSSYRAMLYDPDSDKVVVVSPGESIGSRRVESIDQTSLRIADSDGTRVLSLKPGPGP